MQDFILATPISSNFSMNSRPLDISNVQSSALVLYPCHIYRSSYHIVQHINNQLQTLTNQHPTIRHSDHVMLCLDGSLPTDIYQSVMSISCPLTTSITSFVKSIFHLSVKS